MKVFITNMNRPSVRIVIGRVRRIISGFIKILISPRTKETIKAVIKPLTTTPGTIYAESKIARAFIIKSKSKDILLGLNNIYYLTCLP